MSVNSIRRYPLAGLKVLDLSRILAGPWCTQLLADLGATVYKIERPVVGDDTRGWGPPFVDRGRAAYFLCANRNKYSVAVDFSTQEGAALIRKLASQCDVFVENFKTGGLTRYGLDFPSIHTVQPDMVYATITGFGISEGPRQQEAGFDFMIQALGGLMSTTGPTSAGGYKAGVALTDILTGMYASNAILAALYLPKGQRGCHIDASLFDTQLASLANVATSYLASGKVPARVGNAHVNIVPYSSYPTQHDTEDIVLCVGTDDQFLRLGRLLEMTSEQLQKWKTNRERVVDRVALDAWLSATFASKPRSEWIQLLNDLNLPCAPINNVADAFAEDQAVARGMVWNLKDRSSSSPTLKSEDTLTMRTPGCGVRYSPETPVSTRREDDSWAPPALGVDTERVLVHEESVLSMDELQQLRTKGIVS
jgi:formyl-CoA transferase